MKHSPIKIGFLQAAGIVLYVSLFALAISMLDMWFPSGIKINPFISIALFLLTFVVSATICSGLMFGYPIFLFTKGNKKEAFHVFGWALGWLVFFLIFFGLLVFFFLR
jgi:hypothetical protein